MHSSIRVLQMRMLIVSSIRPLMEEDRPMMEIDLADERGRTVVTLLFPAEMPIRIGQEIGVPRWNKEFLN